jgi:hypothetical protein
MARDEKARERGQPRLDRRSYLKLAGAAATTAAVGGAVGTAGAAEYSKTVDIVQAGADNTGSTDIAPVLNSLAESGTKIEFPPGTYRLSGFSPGWLSNFALVGDDATIVPPAGMTSAIMSLSGRNVTVDGFTFDYTAPNTAPQMSMRCSDGLVLQNCEFVGQADVLGGSGSSSHEYHFFPAVTDASGSGLVKNVTMADGTMSPSNRGGIWFGQNNKGTLTFDGLHMEKWANNSLYCYTSAGPVIVKNSFFRNNNVAGPRIGSDGSRILDTTIVSDGWVPVQEFSGGRTSRGIWVLSACDDVLVQGCDFVMTGPYANRGIVCRDYDANVDVKDCRFVMDVDRSAVEMQQGGAGITVDGVSVTGQASSGHAIMLNGRNGSQVSNVCIQQPNGSRGGVYLGNSSNCAVSDSTINVGGQAITMSGSSADTSNITHSGTCPVADGSNPTGSSDDSSSDDSTSDDSTSDGSTDSGTLSNAVSIDGRYADGPVNYRLTVSGDLQKSDVGESTIDADDSIDGSTATGTVEVDDSDSYDFSGEISELVLDRDTTIWYNGGQLDSSMYTVDASAFDSTDDSSGDSSDDLARELVIDGGTHDHWTYYDFTVGGGLEKAEIDGASINDGDAVSGSSAEGFVAGGADAYRFSGDISEFNLDGDADVYVDGEPVDLSTLPSNQLPNTLVIDGSNAAGRSTYTFEVDGTVEKSRSLGTVTAEDEIDGNAVTGVVVGGTDGYRFSGDITRFQLTGTGEVTFEDNDD